MKLQHELQQILLQKLPRLGELTFGCEVIVEGEKGIVTNSDSYGADILFPSHINQGGFAYGRRTIDRIEILGHPFTHADILEALSIVQNRPFLIDNKGFLYEIEGEEIVPMEIDKLPKNLSDLSFPEYEETCERLISLLK